MSTHLAAVSPAKGQPFGLQTRPTPKPGRGELLLAVKSVALNPADNYMRNQGLFIPSYPTVIGFDISGLVVEVGENVPTDSADAGSGPVFQPGVTRVAAYAASFWRSYKSDYGAFQERCLVPWQHAMPLPDKEMSWNHAATLPVAIQVPLSAWDAMGIPRMEIGADFSSNSHAYVDPDVRGRTQRPDGKHEALLIWGASSSVGTMGVQSGCLLKSDRSSAFAAVYATAGSKNMSYVSLLGADRVFDYKDPHVVDAIVSAAKKDGLVIRHCFLAVGQLQSCQAVLRAFLGVEGMVGKKAKIGSAPIVPADVVLVDGVDIIFLQPSRKEEDRLEQFQYWMGTWARHSLARKFVKPSPEPLVVGKGLETINAGLDLLLQGVSCTKLVVEIGQ